LNSRERVLLALEHEEPDRVPMTDWIYRPESLEAILGESGVRVDTPEKYIKVHEILGLDLIVAYIPSYHAARVEGLKEFVDDWGVRWRVVDGMPWYLEGTLKTAEEIENFVPPDPHNPKLYSLVEEIVKRVDGKMAVAGVADGPFTVGWSAMGFTEYVRALYQTPDLMRRFVQKIAGYYTEVGKHLIDSGVDVIWSPDDLGYSNGPLLSPALLREFIFPYFREEVRTFRKKGVKVLMHNDGQIMPIMDDLVAVGIDGIHPIERAAGMSLELMKSKYGEKLTLIGNVDSKTVLTEGPREAIEKQVLECIRIAAHGGGYILASDHSIHKGIPSGHVRALFEAGKKYGRYPITPGESL
jgi:uroporphyrinogen decarboxylase